MQRRLLGTLALATLLLTACGSDDDAATIDDSGDELVGDTPLDDGENDGEDDADGDGAGDGDGGDDTSDDEAVGDLFDCSLETLQGGDDEFAFVAAYDVIDGELGDICFGDDDPVTTGAWEALAAIAPASQLGDIALFAGYQPDGDLAAETLAFVSALDADGTGFLMAVNSDDAEADPDELLLTMAHEFTHVFTATPQQLDRSDEAFETCDTYFNGDGCYLPESLMFAWITEFWDADVLAGVDVSAEDPDAAEQRCADDEGFFGSYAATNPEEDFAEAFSAFVFEVEPATDGQAERLDWIGAQPGLAEFRDNAVAEGLTPLANNFDVCGF